MSDLLNIGLHAAGGGIFGLFGTLAGRVAGIFESKQKMAHELKTREFDERAEIRELEALSMDHAHEKDLQRLNMEAGARETESELALIASKGSWGGLNKSMDHDNATGLAAQWVINVLRLVRPLLTLLLWIITAWIFSKTQSEGIAEAAVFAATAATLWWFGDRAPKQSRSMAWGPSK